MCVPSPCTDVCAPLAPGCKALTGHLVGTPRRALEARPTIKGKVLRVVDATDSQEPGSTGTDWRLHHSLRLPDLACDYFELTDTHGGEKLGRFLFHPGEVVLADRGDGHRAGVAQVLDAGADVVVRLVPGGFPLLDRNGRASEVLAKCSARKVGPQTRMAGLV